MVGKYQGKVFGFAIKKVPQLSEFQVANFDDHQFGRFAV